MDNKPASSAVTVGLLPLVAAVVPFAATWIAFVLSAQHGHIDPCNPFWDGCTSISRAARHGLGNHVFRAAMLPCATLQIVFWHLCGLWLKTQGRGGSAMLSWFGLVAGLAMILYATFLGTDGDVYRLLRNYGVKLYFAFTYLALLLTLRALARPTRDPAYRPLLVVALGMLALGLASTAVSYLVIDGLLKDRLENALEWQLGLWLTAMFLAFAWRWRPLHMRFAN